MSTVGVLILDYLHVYHNKSIMVVYIGRLVVDTFDVVWDSGRNEMMVF